MYVDRMEIGMKMEDDVTVVDDDHVQFTYVYVFTV